MTKYIAFIRAINVAGHASLKMNDLNRAFVSAGARDVRTVIQSGNVLFTSTHRDASAISRRVQLRLRKSLGNEATILARRLSELESLVRAAPFGHFEGASDVKCYIGFLSEKPRRQPPLPLLSIKEALEAFAMKDREVFVVSRRKANGFYGFPNNFIESELGVVATTRNWSTVTKIVALSSEGSLFVNPHAARPRLGADTKNARLKP
jgi:uncharacterized protein (DUF1697 family)